MRNWLRNKLHQFLYPANEAKMSTVSVRDSGDIDLDAGLRFNVMSARGGTIVQLRAYDQRTDRSKFSTHVIPDGENIAEAIGYIVSMELLSNN